MSEPRRRASERVVDPSYLDAIDKLSMDDLAAMREEVRIVENDVSFERRMCQARIDILSAELDHRAGRVEGDVMSRLAQILADDPVPSSGSPLPQRMPDLSPPKAAGYPHRRIEEIVGAEALARLKDMPEDEIRRSIEGLAELERNLSTSRKQVHDVQDRIQAEIVRRYSTGEVDESNLLS